jgi:hypothetical protein
MLGWIGNLFIVIGLWGVGNKWRPAFLFNMLGESFYIWRSYIVGDWALFAVCWIFMFMAGRAYWKWGQIDAK